MSAKLEKIKEAYGNHYDDCNPDENGWTDWSKGVCELFLELNDNDKIDFLNFDVSNTWRPLVLKGIENNNGWKTVGEDGYPAENQLVSIMHPRVKSVITVMYSCNVFFWEEEVCEGITRWRPLDDVPLPIY